MKRTDNYPHLSTGDNDNNPESLVLAKNRAGYGMGNKCPFFQRKSRVQITESICFISPKKIGFFQSMDESCLNEEDKTMVRQQCQKTDKVFANTFIKTSGNQIDYRSIKKCLSPRSPNPTSSTVPAKTPQFQTKTFEHKYNKDQISRFEIQFYQKIILDLKTQILEMGQIIEQKQRLIEEKDIRISQLERQFYKEQANEAVSDSIKSISTYAQERSAMMQSFSVLNEDEKNDRFAEIEEKLRLYETQLRKCHIQIDVLKKYRFDKEKIQCEWTYTSKKNGSLKRKVERLKEENSKLAKEICKLKLQYSYREDRSILFEFSPQKGSIE